MFAGLATAQKMQPTSAGLRMLVGRPCSSDVSATAQSMLAKNVGLSLKTAAVEIDASYDGQNVVSVQRVSAVVVL